MPAKPRHQTKENRAFGINAGRERRASRGNIEELAADIDRRAAVYRQDAPHAGREPRDVLRAEREAKWLRVRELAAQNRTLAQMSRETGYAVQSIRNFLSKNQLSCRDYKPQGRRGSRADAS
jgi:hypothetical protein